MVAACFLATQPMGRPLAADESSSCCCPHHEGDAECACPVCTHDREVKSGKPFFKTCGSGAKAVAVAAPQVAMPAEFMGGQEPAPHHPVYAFEEAPLPDPAQDVPTPPPLARA